MMIMLDEILNIARESKYDFRETAFPEDPLKHLFPDWISYYKLKWAVARVLQPRSILEIGVGYGYSALAFLNASPSARYVDIDFESPIFGGTLEADARKIESALRSSPDRMRIGARYSILDTRSGGSDIYEMGVTAPEVPGNYLLRITLVQERIRWLDQAPYRVYCDLPIACGAEND
jgi:hypothetical protein